MIYVIDKRLKVIQKRVQGKKLCKLAITSLSFFFLNYPSIYSQLIPVNNECSAQEITILNPSGVK